MTQLRTEGIVFVSLFIRQVSALCNFEFTLTYQLSSFGSFLLQNAYVETLTHINRSFFVIECHVSCHRWPLIKLTHSTTSLIQFGIDEPTRSLSGLILKNNIRNNLHAFPKEVSFAWHLLAYLMNHVRFRWQSMWKRNAWLVLVTNRLSSEQRLASWSQLLPRKAS